MKRKKIVNLERVCHSAHSIQKVYRFSAISLRLDGKHVEKRVYRRFTMSEKFAIWNQTVPMVCLWYRRVRSTRTPNTTNAITAMLLLVSQWSNQNNVFLSSFSPPFSIISLIIFHGRVTITFCPNHNNGNSSFASSCMNIAQFFSHSFQCSMCDFSVYSMQQFYLDNATRTSDIYLFENSDHHNLFQWFWTQPKIMTI